MNLIKTYLLPLVLLLFISNATIAQSFDNNNVQDSNKVKNLLTDSIIVNHYYSEADYNRNNSDKNCKIARDSDYIYEDEIYSDKQYKKKGDNTFWNSINGELVVDVVVNALFFVAILWQ